VTLRCSDEEYELLSKHCEKKERSLNDVLRELVRLSNQSRRERRGLYPNFPVTGLTILTLLVYRIRTALGLAAKQVLPSDEAALKMLYLGLPPVASYWTRPS
uniref:ribbon-helix-helix protein, CopG family n=2 Tax=Candidatus Cyanaurora vandensis TaxID=2714958 RepID=UPI00258005AC